MLNWRYVCITISTLDLEIGIEPIKKVWVLFALVSGIVRFQFSCQTFWVRSCRFRITLEWCLDADWTHFDRRLCCPDVLTTFLCCFVDVRLPHLVIQIRFISKGNNTIILSLFFLCIFLVFASSWFMLWSVVRRVVWLSAVQRFIESLDFVGARVCTVQRTTSELAAVCVVDRREVASWHYAHSQVVHCLFGQ